MNENQPLPHADKAEIPTDKLTKYSLNYNKSKDKATAFFLALGFTLDNYPELIEQVRKKLPLYKSVYRGKSEYGDRYQVIMTISGINGKQAEVLTAWIIENGKQYPVMTNIYVTNKKGTKLC
ncbi:MAG: hypothetical protein LBN97_05395 [Oscillospiraceae bacterium]|jgi:hypothetical protein|nr:hypothetical protein [Oscillospiraceae bacterium]